jgi:hypothetical protein
MAMLPFYFLRAIKMALYIAVKKDGTFITFQEELYSPCCKSIGNLEQLNT